MKTPFVEVSYNINRERGIITAYTRNCTNVSAFMDRDMFWMLAEICKDRWALLPKTVYVGQAKCSQHDEWNEETGKRIARARAIKALMNDVLNVWRNARRKLDNVTRNSDEIFAKLERDRDVLKAEIRDV